MTGLEQTYYIIGIICMSTILLMLIFLLASVLVIRNKIVRLEHTVEERLVQAAKPVNKMVEIAQAVKEVAKSVK